MPKQFLTAIFKIHNPSTRKREIMDYVLEQYTLAYQGLLDWAEGHKSRIAQEGKYVYNRRNEMVEKYTGKSIAQLLPRPNFEVHSSVKDSLIQDVAGNLASYFALAEIDPRTSFPTSRNPSPIAFSNALEDFSKVGLEDYEHCKDRLTAIAGGKVMPLYFARSDATIRNRNFSLLYDTNKKRYFALMYLLPKRHSLCKSLPITNDNLIQVDTGEIVHKTTRTKTAILVPLELGGNGWQEQKFLLPAMDAKGQIKSAYLRQNNGDYFLHVSFAFDCPQLYNAKTYLGVDSGILFTAAYSLIDSKGKLIELGHFDDSLCALQVKHSREREQRQRNGKAVIKRHYRTGAYDNILHNLVNLLIEKALENQAQIVIEDLNIEVRGSRVSSRFKKMGRILEYKCKLTGVPLRSVFAAWSSILCHRCGEKGQAQGCKDREFVCPSCGLKCHRDDNAAVNIARRALYYKADWQSHFEFHKSFASIATLKAE